MLNKALLAAHYDIEYWDIPDTYLCPPIPGRADYVHRVAELLDVEVKGKYVHHKVRALDVGVGANCIYPYTHIKCSHLMVCIFAFYFTIKQLCYAMNVIRTPRNGRT